MLGSPVGGIESLSGAIVQKVERLDLMGGRLHLMHAHDTLLLLRHSFAMPKILHMLRSAPCFLSPAVETYDSLLRKVLGDITNVCLEEDETWTQASLPVGAGGIGVRRAAQLAPSAFLASAAGCSELVAQILPPQMQGVPNPSRDAALVAWQHGHSEVPSGAASHRQKAWDAPLIQVTYDALMGAAYNPSILELIFWLWHPKRLVRGLLPCQSPPWAFAWMMRLYVLQLGCALELRFVLLIVASTVVRTSMKWERMVYLAGLAVVVSLAMQPSMIPSRDH